MQDRTNGDGDRFSKKSFGAVTTEEKRGHITKDSPLSRTRQCELLHIARSGLYYRPHPKLSAGLFQKVQELSQKHPHYGYRRITHAIRRSGTLVNYKAVYGLMKRNGIRAIFPTKIRTSAPCKAHSKRAYLLEGLLINRPNLVWSTDITYISLPQGTVYLFALVDLNSRFILAHCLVNTMEAWHAIRLLEDALQYGTPAICNSDQGSQFTSTEWIQLLEHNGIAVSHDGRGRFLDNILVERVWRSTKYENILPNVYENIVEARKGIRLYVKHYNYERPHQSLKYNTPAEVYFGHVKAPPYIVKRKKWS